MHWNDPRFLQVYGFLSHQTYLAMVFVKILIFFKEYYSANTFCDTSLRCQIQIFPLVWPQNNQPHFALLSLNLFFHFHFRVIKSYLWLQISNLIKKQNALEVDVEAYFKVDGLDWKHWTLHARWNPLVRLLVSYSWIIHPL